MRALELKMIGKSYPRLGKLHKKPMVELCYLVKSFAEGEVLCRRCRRCIIFPFRARRVLHHSKCDFPLYNKSVLIFVIWVNSFYEIVSTAFENKCKVSWQNKKFKKSEDEIALITKGDS